jgi:hypothetical protein
VSETACEKFDQALLCWSTREGMSSRSCRSGRRAGCTSCYRGTRLGCMHWRIAVDTAASTETLDSTHSTQSMKRVCVFLNTSSNFFAFTFPTD